MQTPMIDDKASKLIAAFRALGGGWFTRAQIATQMGRPYLSPVDITLLEMLVRDGVIESDTQPGTRRNLLRFVYRLKGGDQEK